MNEAIDLMMKRKSVRAFSNKEISDKEKEIILRAACASPSAGNQQLYTILDITDPSIKQELVDTCDHQSFIAQAKLVLIFCADCKKWYDAFLNSGSNPRKPQAGDLLLAVSDANIASMSAVIAAESFGIGSCYIGDIMENCERQRELLHLPEYVFPCAMVVFGYPHPSISSAVKPERAPLDAIVFENHYPDEMNDLHLFSNRYQKHDYAEWMRSFCKRKYNSAFSIEMSRSVKEYLKQFE